jgi:Family of unknown function (DUF6524)
MLGEGISWKGFGGRFVAAGALVYATFNPEGYSFFHWAIAPISRGQTESVTAQAPLKVLAGLCLLGLWIFFVHITRRSIGAKGALLLLGILGALVWLLVDWHVLSPTSSRAIGHVVLIAISLILAIGLTWSHLSRRISGQVDTDLTN